jgi:hypothetical protein
MKCVVLGAMLALPFAPASAQVAEAPIPPLIVDRPAALPLPPPQPAPSAHRPIPTVDLPKSSGAVSQAGTQPQAAAELARPRPLRRKQRPPVKEIVQPLPVTHAVQHKGSESDYTAEQLNAEQLGASPRARGIAPDTIADKLNREELEVPWASVMPEDRYSPYPRSTDQ